jgi:hypothetical protein
VGASIFFTAAMIHANNTPLPRDLADLKAWFIAAVKNIDVCRVTRGTHIEHL